MCSNEKGAGSCALMGWEVDCGRMHVATQITGAACPGAAAALRRALIPAHLLQSGFKMVVMLVELRGETY